MKKQAAVWGFILACGIAVPFIAGASMDDTIKQWAENSVKFDAAVSAGKKEGAPAGETKEEKKGEKGGLVKQIKAEAEKKEPEQKGGVDLKTTMPPEMDAVAKEKALKAATLGEAWPYLPEDAKQGYYSVFAGMGLIIAGAAAMEMPPLGSGLMILGAATMVHGFREVNKSSRRLRGEGQ